MRPLRTLIMFSIFSAFALLSVIALPAQVRAGERRHNNASSLLEVNVSASNPKHPLVKQLQQVVPGEATAGTDRSVVVGRAPLAATITGVSYTPSAAINGANTNTRRIALINRGQNGAGAVVISELQFNSGINAPAFDEKTVPLSVTSANLSVAEGDILEWLSDAVGTGLADPGGLVVVTMNRS